MKKESLATVFFLTLFIMYAPLHAQTYKNENNSPVTMLQAKEINPSTLVGFGIMTPNSQNQSTTGNTIFLSQVGNTNTANIQVFAQNSDLNLSQRGEANEISLDYTVKSVYAALSQQGNQNTITDFVNDPTASTSLELEQNGNYLNFERNGVNELTNSLKFKQNGNGQSLIVRSFN